MRRGGATGKTDVEVTIDSGLKGKGLQERLRTKGTHVLTDLNFLNSFDNSSGMYNGLLNVTHGQTEDLRLPSRSRSWVSGISGTLCCALHNVPNRYFSVMLSKLANALWAVVS